MSSLRNGGYLARVRNAQIGSLAEYPIVPDEASAGTRLLTTDNATVPGITSIVASKFKTMRPNTHTTTARARSME